MQIREAKTVLVTGAEGALGRVIAKKFLGEGRRVLGTHLPSIPTAALPPIPGIEWLAVDVTAPASVRGRLTESIDALVHCAGGFRYSKLDEMSDADIDFLLDVNLKSAILLLREVLPGMKRRGFGRVVLVSARATLSPPAGMAVYCATKTGLNALAASLAEELKDLDINVNTVMPSIIDTPANRKEMPTADFSKWVTPEALAEIVFTLTQPVSAPIRGAAVPVPGRS